MAPKRRPGGAPRFCSECGSAQKGPWVKACHGCGRVFREDNPPKLHYELHSGRNRFWCGGRCLTAPSLTLFYANVFLTVTVSTLWFVFDAAYLWEQVSPVLVIYVALLVAFSLSSLFFAAFTDPGIVPRGEDAEIQDGHDRVTNLVSYSIRGKKLQLKYCATCKIYRPPRASHCRQCNNCVEGFDHHCPWVGNCVGARNYRFFFSYVVSKCLLCLSILATAAAHLGLLVSREGMSFGEAIAETPAAIVEILFALGFGLSLIGLCSYHMQLVRKGATTNEEINFAFGSKSPYDRGSVWKNIAFRLCGPRLPSQLRARMPLVDGKPTNRAMLPLQSDLDAKLEAKAKANAERGAAAVAAAPPTAMALALSGVSDGANGATKPPPSAAPGVAAAAGFPAPPAGDAVVLVPETAEAAEAAEAAETAEMPPADSSLSQVTLI